MKRIQFIIHLFVLVFIMTSCSPSAKYLRSKKLKITNGNNYVRVLIGIKKNPIKIDSKSRLRVIDKDSYRVVSETQSGKLLLKPKKIKKPYIIETEGTPIFCDGKGYRGKLELHNILDKIYIVNIVNVEEYLYSVVPSEMPASWNIEALKAQAVAARTYTYYHLLEKKKTKAIYDLDATTNFQVYKGIINEKPSSILAVQKTLGVIMTYEHLPILALFHSTSGGKTIDDKFVWGNTDLPYLQGVRCSYEKDSPHFSWDVKLSFYEIKSGLAKKYKRIGKIKKISFKKNDGRVSKVEILHQYGKISMTGNDFRLLFPPKKLRSTFFKSAKYKNGLHIKGRGWGHGVGMSQWGAKGRAEKGFAYQDILKHYYSGINFEHIKSDFSVQNRSSRNLVN